MRRGIGEGIFRIIPMKEIIQKMVETEREGQQKLAEADRSAQQIAEEARHEAARIAEEARREARRLTEEILAKARAEAEELRRRHLAELQQDIVSLDQLDPVRLQRAVQMVAAALKGASSSLEQK